MTRERARDLVRVVLGTSHALEVNELLDVADGPLRGALVRQLGVTSGGMLADRICDLLMRHATSGIRTKADVFAANEKIVVGIVGAPDEARRHRLLAAVKSLGATAVVVEIDPSLGDADADAGPPLDALLVPSDLPVSQVRELAWRNAQLDDPALVVVWPVDEVAAAWGRALHDAVYLEEPSVPLLAATLISRLRRPRRCASSEAGA